MPIIEERIPFWRVKCDCCGTTSQPEWETPQQAAEVARQQGWGTRPRLLWPTGDVWLCPVCHRDTSEGEKKA